MKAAPTPYLRSLITGILLALSGIMGAQVDSLAFAEFSIPPGPEVVALLVAFPTPTLETVPAGCEPARGGGEPLALRVTDLQARRRSRKLVDLSWEVETSELEMLWMLERRLDSETTFSVIATLTDFRLREQTYTDQNPHPGITYYRMRGRAADGATELTDVESVANDRSTVDLTVYPNPVSANLPVTVQLPSDERGCELRLTDSQGRIIRQQTFPSKAGRVVSFTLGSVAPGMYTVQWIEAGGDLQTTRLIVGY